MIITFFFNKYRISAWVLSGVYLLIIIQKYLLLAVALAGLFDQWIDFRKLRQPVAKNPDEDLE